MGRPTAGGPIRKESPSAAVRALDKYNHIPHLELPPPRPLFSCASTFQYEHRCEEFPSACTATWRVGSFTQCLSEACRDHGRVVCAIAHRPPPEPHRRQSQVRQLRTKGQCVVTRSAGASAGARSLRKRHPGLRCSGSHKHVLCAHSPPSSTPCRAHAAAPQHSQPHALQRPRHLRQGQGPHRGRHAPRRHLPRPLSPLFRVHLAPQHLHAAHAAAGGGARGPARRVRVPACRGGGARAKGRGALPAARPRARRPGGGVRAQVQAAGARTVPRDGAPPSPPSFPPVPHSACRRCVSRPLHLLHTSRSALAGRALTGSNESIVGAGSVAACR